MQRALIIGCGYTGAALARLLRDDQIPVTGTSAGSGEDEPVPVPGVVMQQLDLLDKTRELELPAAAGAVVYYMVATLFRRYDDRERPHLTPMRRCLAALARQPIQGLIYLSSTSVYGDRQGGWVDEQTPTRPRSPWGRMRVELEQLVWEFGAASQIPSCVVRLPEIYGPGRGPTARLRRGYQVRFPDRYSNRIHVDDLARVLRELGRRLDQELLLVCDGNPATTKEVYDFASSQLGLPPPVATADSTADANRRALLSESKRCRNDKLVQWLGVPLLHPTYRRGIAAVLASEGEPG